jgi:hypothetical protein
MDADCSTPTEEDYDSDATVLYDGNSGLPDIRVSTPSNAAFCKCAISKSAGKLNEINDICLAGCGVFFNTCT